ncbi:IS66 family transposase [Spartinivicinus marinus]|uniref:IS66 family transposase n=1 Tax=Spartinivicinus marinus TaxID=2994442 RepID=UPI00225A6D79|nr:transposase [Spartinivicinus marinus]MCX4025329.1 transposase [Spartinivicinus marinus]MCX4029051.1 transposase [Spartinivicinus marinus]MCX4029282.1 transposase [Spartinivicinus marinus]
MKLPKNIASTSQQFSSSYVEELSSLLQEKEAIIADNKRLIDQKCHIIEEQQKRIAILEEYLRLERHRRFGPSSEKNTAQGELFNEAEQLEQQANTADGEESKPQPPKKKGGRKGLSPAIPREQIYLTLSEEDKAGALDTFFVKVKEELDIIPAKVRVLEYLQEKAVFEDDNAQRTIKSALQPQHPLPKSVASTGMLAYIIVAKYMDALPLHRLEGIFNRYGGSVTRTTMANWLIKLARPLQPLINLLRDHQLVYELIQADETRIQVLKEPGRSPTSNKYMWVTLGGPPEQPAVLFTYDASREKEVPLRLFEGYQGYLQTDGYAAYDAVCQENSITRLGFRVDEDVTALTPHRPGRAQLTHPVPHRYCLAS